MHEEAVDPRDGHDEDALAFVQRRQGRREESRERLDQLPERGQELEKRTTRESGSPAVAEVDGTGAAARAAQALANAQAAHTRARQAHAWAVARHKVAVAEHDRAALAPGDRTLQTGANEVADQGREAAEQAADGSTVQPWRRQVSTSDPGFAEDVLREGYRLDGEHASPA